MSFYFLILFYFNFIPQTDLAAVYLFVGIHVHGASALYCPCLLFSGIITETLTVFIGLSY